MLYHADRPNNGFAKIVKLPMDGKNTVVYVTVKMEKYSYTTSSKKEKGSGGEELTIPGSMRHCTPFQAKDCTSLEAIYGKG
jgi:hypothetical protein